MAIQALRMHFLVQGHATSFDDDARAQPLPALIRRQVRPVDDQKNLRHTTEPTRAESRIKLMSCRLQGNIAEQPVDTF